jgi:hypothetical protein
MGMSQFIEMPNALLMFWRRGHFLDVMLPTLAAKPPAAPRLHLSSEVAKQIRGSLASYTYVHYNPLTAGRAGLGRFSPPVRAAMRPLDPHITAGATKWNRMEL